MRMTLAAKFLLLVSAVMGLGLGSALLGMFIAASVQGAFADTVNEILPSVVASEELEVALLVESRALRALALETGNPRWRNELDAAAADYEKWYAEALRTSHTAEELAILERLKRVHVACSAKRDEIVNAAQAGQAETSLQASIKQYEGLSRQGFDLCEDFLALNQDIGRDDFARVRTQVKYLSMLVSIGVAATIAAGIALYLFISRGVLTPLRRMADEAQGLLSAGGRSRSRDGADELGIVGGLLRSLMSDVVDARHSLDQQQERLAEVEKRMVSVGKLAASVAHEIRNPLNAVRMSLVLLRRTAKLDAHGQRTLNIADEEITRLDRMIRSFLEFSRPPQLRLEPVDLAALVASVRELVAPAVEQKQIRLDCEEAPTLPTVLADGDQLRQVLMNLIKNAAEATPAGGKIHVHSAIAESDGRGFVVLRIHNTGAAIPQDVQQRLFEPFYTTKSGGTGLGLAIAARIMAQHGGRLWLESTSAAGSTFAISLPAAAPPSVSLDGEPPVAAAELDARLDRGHTSLPSATRGETADPVPPA